MWRSTTLPPRNPGELPEVYWRPDDAELLDPRRLLAVLKTQFGVAATIMKQPDPRPVVSAAPLPPKMPSIKKQAFTPPRIAPVNRTVMPGSIAAGAGKKPGKVPLSRELRDVKKMLRQAAKETPKFKAVDDGGEPSDDDL